MYGVHMAKDANPDSVRPAEHTTPVGHLQVSSCGLITQEL